MIRREEGVIWLEAMFTDEYNLNVTRPVGKCFQRLASNPAYQEAVLVINYMGIYVVVQFYPWFKFYILCFGYSNLMIMNLKQRKLNLNQG